MFHIRHVDGYYQDLTFCICFGKVDMSQSAGYGIGGCVSEMDFRPEGFGIVRIHGPFIFKWEMCVSEEGHRPVEGIMSVFDLPVYDSHLLQTNLEMHPHVRKMIDPLLGIYDGRNKVDICSVYPLPAKCALGCLRAQDELFNQVAFPRCRLPALPFSTVSNAGCCCSSARHCTSSLFVRPWWNLAREKRRKI